MSKNFKLSEIQSYVSLSTSDSGIKSLRRRAANSKKRLIADREFQKHQQSIDEAMRHISSNPRYKSDSDLVRQLGYELS